MRKLVSIALLGLLLVSASSAHAGHTATLETLLGQAIKERRNLPQKATVAIVNLSVGNPVSWKDTTQVISVTLPSRERGTGLIAAQAMVSTATGTRVIWVRCQAQIQAPVVVATQPLSRRAIVAPNDVKIAWRTLGYQTPFFKVEDVIGKRLKTSVTPNTLINPRMVRTVAPVQRGSRVQVHLRSGAVSIRTTGEALSRGNIGDRIRIRIIATGKTLSGLIRAAGQVEVSR